MKDSLCQLLLCWTEDPLAAADMSGYKVQNTYSLDDRDTVIEIKFSERYLVTLSIMLSACDMTLPRHLTLIHATQSMVCIVPISFNALPSRTNL